MKHFANYIEIYPESVVDSIDETTVTTSDASEADRIIAKQNVVLNETPGEDNGNSFFSQQLNVVSDGKLSDEIRSKYVNKRPVVVRLFTDDQAALLLGDKQMKARITITPNLESDVITVDRNSINPIL